MGGEAIRQRVGLRIDRLENGNFGDYKQLTSDLYELRLKFGSGYRIYFAQQEKNNNFNSLRR